MGRNFWINAFLNHMPNKSKPSKTNAWIQGELQLSGILDKRMINLLKAIEQSGSINQAAKQVGLSYKGAWQIIERANNLAPKVLVATATGGSKGGGTSLTAAGLALLKLFIGLEQEHQDFLQQLNERISNDPDLLLLLRPLTIKTSATNQLFGSVTAIQTSSIYAEVFVALKGGEQIVASLPLAEFEQLNLSIGSDVLLLINAAEIMVVSETDNYSLSARNHLRGSVLRFHDDGVDAEVVMHLTDGDSLVITVTKTSAETLGIALGVSVIACFKSNAVMLAGIPPITA
jgi:molybdate transport system regulatory protein